MDMTKNKAYDMGKRTIDNILIDVFGEDVDSDCHSLLDYCVGTTGYKGGDSGHGGRTIIRFEDVVGDLDIRVRPLGEEHYIDLYDEDEMPFYKGAEIILGGDWELGSCIEVLENALDTLKSISATTVNNIDDDIDEDF